MRKATVLRSRWAVVATIAHFVLLVAAYAVKPTVPRSVSNQWQENGAAGIIVLTSNGPGYTAMGKPLGADFVAERLVHFSYESPLMKTLQLIDMPAFLLVGLPLSLATGRLSASLLPYQQSWVAAAIIAFSTSLQWWLLGFLAERRRAERRHEPLSNSA